MSGQQSLSHLESYHATTATLPAPSSRPESFRTNSNDSATPRPTKLYITRPDPRNTTRRPIPSPLQASLTSSTSGENLNSPALSSASPRSLSFAVPGSSPSPRSPISPTWSAREAPRSPRERLDALLAGEGPLAGGSDAPTASATRAKAFLPARSTTQLRNFSAPLPSSQQDAAPPTSPTSMAAAVSRPSRPDPRPIAPPRNASIDSAASAVSSNASHSMQSNGSHSYKSSQDTTASTPPDVQSMIVAAGSAESLIHNLIKDKQAAQARDSQLWRLVEKQRAMILGLNKDLDRALKDKEKYRKKLKEHLAAVARSSPSADGVLRRDGTPSSMLSDQSLGTISSNQSRDTISGLQALHSGSSATSSPSHNPEAKPSPQNLITAALVADAQEVESTGSASPKDLRDERKYSEDVGSGTSSGKKKASVDDSSSKHSREDSYTPGQDVITTPKRDTFAQPPTVSLTQATPTLGAPPSPAERPSPAPKKGPPAPLNLSHPNRVSNHLHAASNDRNTIDSESEYDDILEVEEMPIFEERGRRKTRQEDEEQREALAFAEEEARSQSAKLKKKPSKGSKSGKSQSKVNSPQSNGLSSSSSGPSDGNLSSPTVPKYGAVHPNQESISALLSPTSSDVPSQRSNLVSPLASPGLPTSPRPGDRPMNSPTPRMPQKSIASPPTSPRPVNNTMPLSPRAPKQPIPMPPNSPLSSASPHLARAEQYQKQAEQASIDDRLRPDTPEESPVLERQESNFTETPGEHVFTGFVSANYPRLLVPPSALSAIHVRVYSSRLKPSRASFIAPKPEEDPVFTLGIYARSDGRQLWRVEKTILALPAFDQQIKSSSSFREKLPDRALFNGHAPAKIDARRTALNTYFRKLLETPFEEQAAVNVCKFLSSDVIGVEEEDHRNTLLIDGAPGANSQSKNSVLLTQDGRARKDGYLTKRGKNFGGWKARYFVLDGPQLRYFEAPGGAHLGSIKLPGAQIGKQSSHQANQSPSSHDEDADNQYRHAFLILEPKRKDSSSLVRHVLCAESDEERDSWVDALMTYVDYQEENQNSKQSQSKLQKGPKSPTLPKEQYDDRPPSSRQTRQSSLSRPSNEIRAFHYEDTVAAEAPRMVGPKGTPSPPMQSESPDPGVAPTAPGNHPAISGPRNAAKIVDNLAWGNKPQTAKEKEPKKRSIFGFRQRVSSDFATLAGSVQGHSNAHHASEHHHHHHQYSGQVRAAFGAPLSEAVYYSPPENVDVNLPAVVYRCLEYLIERNAANEEGIFRLSGSNLVIKALRERFNTEGDVRLMEGPYYDIHAVASLLKLYLRELPSSILTRELHLEFLKALDFDEKQKKVTACNVLVHRLPTANYELLKALSSYLLVITNNAEVNKMGVRNVGIVFAPTLNIPAPLISLLLSDHDYIFGEPIDEAQSPIKEITVEPPSQDSIRSPRRQMFSDLPTPSYNSSFPADQYPGATPAPLFSSVSTSNPDDLASHSRSNSRTDADSSGGTGLGLGATGFIPMQPSYAYQENGYGSLNGALATAPPEKSAERLKALEKRNRRESGMLMINMMAAQREASAGGRRQSSMSSLRRVGEESTFYHE
ncbi:MAG: hypothetical protein M1822_003229 [Bathelium mastoideum]|nr:MAG: hypothetical protein M1822_003229 [Bathelium mastoideum]